MPNESTKRVTSEPETPQGQNVAPFLKAASPVLDAASIAALRTFFELLDVWDLKENPDEKWPPHPQR